jgi:lipid II:glycine glycyltransferase (peptidoglycan interpeptide bridge formation enzyme)
MRPLLSGYCPEIDTVDDATWVASIASFSDANLYQLWSHGSAFEGFGGVSRLVLKKGNQIVAAAELRLFVMPVAGYGVAYVRWGPLWRTTGDTNSPDSLEHFQQVIRAMRNEYVNRRKLVLRLNPRLWVEDHQDFGAILTDEGFSTLTGSAVEKSIVMDLTQSLERLRAGFDKKWRNCLSKAERGELTVVRGTSLALFEEFSTVYGEMLRRKRFVPSADLEKHRRLQVALPDHLRMGIVVARDQGVACAGAVYHALGETAVYLFGATNESGMRTAGAYLVQWELLKALKERGTRVYDLHGVNLELNPGTYRFKKGLAGKAGREVTFVGQRQAFLPSVANCSLLLGEKVFRMIRSSDWLQKWKRSMPVENQLKNRSGLTETTV